MTRSEFLTMTALTGGAAFLAACGGGRETESGGSDDPGKALPSRGPGRSPAAAAGVLAVATGPAAAANTERAMTALGGMGAFVRRGDVVVVKPNICTAKAPEYATTTDPDVVATLVRLAREAGAKQVIVMDNPLSDAAAAYSASGIEAAATAAGGAMHLMNDAGYRSYAIPGHVLGTHPLYAAIVDADVVISAPIAKQHGSAGLTLAGKNLMGATSDRGRMHSMGLSQCIAELAAALRPDLAVIDATRILVRNGPTGGDLADVVVKDTVIACADWVAADTYATRLFDRTPEAVPYIKAAADMGLGTMDLASVSIRSV
ncbi:MAG TPA: DUF362 domain-containing protein [Vicinamibacterales bacterium]|nr:DUF362 domain-containing protein [Vicinamibacterales bacterium]